LALPGQEAVRIGPQIILRPASVKARATVNSFAFPLSIPGEVLLPHAGCAVSAELADDIDASAIASNRSVARVRRELCPGRLTVRHRRPGDRFSPVGLGGRKKLQDFFVDRKIARQDRDLVPLIVDENDRIVWVAGYALDEAFRVTDPAQAVLILRIKRLGGSA